MSSMDATDKKRVGFLVKIRTMAKVAHLAKVHKISRNAEVELIFSKATENVELTDEELAAARAEEDEKRQARESGKKERVKRAKKARKAKGK